MSVPYTRWVATTGNSSVFNILNIEEYTILVVWCFLFDVFVFILTWYQQWFISTSVMMRVCTHWLYSFESDAMINELKS